MDTDNFSSVADEATNALLREIIGLNAADAVEWLNVRKTDEVSVLIRLLPFERAVAILDQPELRNVASVISLMPVKDAACLLDGMADDRATDVFHELDETTRARLTARVAAHTRVAIQKLMDYPPETAGSMMTTEFASVPSDWTIGETLAYIRRVESSKETIYVIYVLDKDDDTLRHVVTLRRLITGKADDSILSVAQDNALITTSPLTDQEEVARLIRRHDMFAIPVVDEAQHILGIVTVDDVIDAIIAETTEDAHKFGGMETLGKPYMQIGFFQMIHKRAGWLAILFLGEMLTASAMQHYEVQLERAIVLTLFIPLIMSSGGNSGSQATSLLIRDLALRNVRLRDWWRVALREIPTGIVLGTILGFIGLVRIVSWQMLGFYDYGEHWILIALTIWLSLVGIVTFGSLSGSMLPFVLQKLGFDPASASAPLVATLVDVTGLVIYFSAASLILRGTLL